MWISSHGPVNHGEKKTAKAVCSRGFRNNPKCIWNVDVTVSWAVVCTYPLRLCTLGLWNRLSLPYALCSMCLVLILFKEITWTAKWSGVPHGSPSRRALHLTQWQGRSWEFLNSTVALRCCLWVERPKAEKSELWRTRKFLLRVQRACGYQSSTMVQEDSQAVGGPSQHRP